MRFRVPPQWPQPPSDWIPDPGWQPDSSWPPAPPGWDFWVNDYDVPIEGPKGLYGSSTSRLRGARVVLASAAGLGALLLGVMMGAGASGSSGSGNSLAPLPTHTARVTVTASPSPAVTVTAPPETVTAAPETVTATPDTVTVTIEVPEPSGDTSGYGFVDPPDSGSSSVYYDNCTAVREAGAAPIYRGDPGYRSGLDRDDDGVACE